jgi:hypothetical protein
MRARTGAAFRSYKATLQRYIVIQTSPESRPKPDLTDIRRIRDSDRKCAHKPPCWLINSQPLSCTLGPHIQIDLREIGLDGMDRIDMAQDRDQWRAFVSTEMNLQVT